MIWDLTQECVPSTDHCPSGALERHRLGFCGTRVYAPAAWDASRPRLDQYALDRMVAVVQTVDVRGVPTVSAERLDAAWPQGPPAPAVMLVTGQHHYWGCDQYQRSMTALTIDGADYLRQRAVRLVLLDTPGLGWSEVYAVLAAQDILLVSQVGVPADLPPRFLGLVTAARMREKTSAPARLLAMD